jgi:hypothetical protein
MTIETRQFLHLVWNRRGCSHQRRTSRRRYVGGQSFMTTDTREFLHLLGQYRERKRQRTRSRRYDLAGLAIALVLAWAGARYGALSVEPVAIGWVGPDELTALVSLLVIAVSVALIPYRIGKPRNSTCSFFREPGFIASSMMLALGFLSLC